MMQQPRRQQRYLTHDTILSFSTFLWWRIKHFKNISIHSNTFWTFKVCKLLRSNFVWRINNQDLWKKKIDKRGIFSTRCSGSRVCLPHPAFTQTTPTNLNSPAPPTIVLGRDAGGPPARNNHLSVYLLISWNLWNLESLNNFTCNLTSESQSIFRLRLSISVDVS